MTTAAAIEMTTARGSKDVWWWRQSTVARVNSIDSQRGWQPMGVAADSGGGQWGRRQQGQMSGVDGLLSGRRSGGGKSSVLRSPTLHLVQTKNEWEISHSRWEISPQRKKPIDLGTVVEHKTLGP